MHDFEVSLLTVVCIANRKEITREKSGKKQISFKSKKLFSHRRRPYDFLIACSKIYVPTVRQKEVCTFIVRCVNR
jgi:hypothetical protein